MKKILFFAAIAAVALASCSSDDSVATDLAQVGDDGAISFNAYSGTTTVTRGTTMSTKDFTDPTKGGVGVFAFYQPATDGVAGPNFTTVKYSTANFMYNQKVAYDAVNTKWSYSPVKYWPNNKGDKVTYFAYAPYEETTVWDDLNVSTNNSGTTVYRKFSVNSNVDEQTDYLFAAPNLNLTKPTTISDNANPVGGTGSATVTDATTATTKTNVVNFDFMHVTSKINLYVGVQVNDNPDHAKNSTSSSSYSDASTATDAKAWTDPNTTIEIKSIQFKDLAKDFTVTATYTDPNDAACSKATITSVGSTDNSERNQTYVVKPYVGENYSLLTVKPFEFDATKYYTIDGTNYVKVTAAADWEKNKYYSQSVSYELLATAPNDWSSTYTNYYTFDGSKYTQVATAATAPSFELNKYYQKEESYTAVANPFKATNYYTYDAATGVYTQVSDADTKWEANKYYVKSTNNGLIDTNWVAGWHRYLYNDSRDYVESNATTNDDNNQYMFIAPQKVGEDQQIVITYTVTTKVEPGKTNNNDSQVTNTIVKTWKDLGISELQYGKQYQLFFLIGMQDVKVAATTSNWEAGSNNLVNVPSANETPVLP